MIELRNSSSDDIENLCRTPAFEMAEFSRESYSESAGRGFEKLNFSDDLKASALKV